MSIRTLIPEARLFIHWQLISLSGGFLLRWVWPVWVSKALLTVLFDVETPWEETGILELRKTIFLQAPHQYAAQMASPLFPGAV